MPTQLAFTTCLTLVWDCLCQHVSPSSYTARIQSLQYRDIFRISSARIHSIPCQDVSGSSGLWLLSQVKKRLSCTQPLDRRKSWETSWCNATQSHRAHWHLGNLKESVESSLVTMVTCSRSSRVSVKVRRRFAGRRYGMIFCVDFQSPFFPWGVREALVVARQSGTEDMQ